MPTKTIKRRTVRCKMLQRSMPVLALGLLAIIGSFSIGVRSSGDVIGDTAASEMDILEGDMDGDGSVDARDVRMALDIVLGTLEATPQQLHADPTRDGRITLEDARQIADISSR